MFECFDSDLEQQALLRIDPVSFARRNTEEVSVERIDIVQERTPLCRCRECSCSVRGAIIERVPAPFWHGRNR